MTRIAALNDWSLGSSEEEDAGPTREALEAEATKNYNEAIRYLAHGNLESAYQHFCQVLQNPYIEKAGWTDGVVTGGALPQDVALRYSCLKNLGNLATKRGEDKEAVEYYLEAVRLDNSEVTLWQRLGASAIKLNDFELALVAFQEGLTVNPKHWPCLDQLLSVMFILQMYMECIGLAINALARDPGYIKALAFKDKIFELQPSLMTDVKFFFRDSSVLFKDVDYDKAKGAAFIATCETLRPQNKTFQPPQSLQPQQLQMPLPPKLSWESLADALVLTYDSLIDADGTEFAARIDVISALRPEEVKVKCKEENTDCKEMSSVRKLDFESGHENGENANDLLTENPKNKQDIANDAKEGDRKQEDVENNQLGFDKHVSPVQEQNGQGSPLRISNRRRTIELGESQDSFRVGEKRRSIDSDTVSRSGDELKLNETVNESQSSKSAALHEGEKDEADDKLIPSNEKIEELVKSSKPLTEEMIAMESDVNEVELSCANDTARLEVKDKKTRISVDKSGCKKQSDTADNKHLRRDVNINEGEHDEDSDFDFKGFSPIKTPKASRINLLREKLASSSVTDPNKENQLPASDKDDTTEDEELESNNTEKQDKKETSDKEDTEITDNMQKMEDPNEAPTGENLTEVEEGRRGSTSSNENLEQGHRELDDAGDQQEDEEKEFDENGEKNIEDDDVHKDNEDENEEKTPEDNEEKIYEEEENNYEESEQKSYEEDEMRDVSMVEGDELEEEAEEEEEEEEEENIGLEQNAEGMQEEEDEEEEMNETEAAVNTLKGIMALQPTEILGLPEPDFDYDNEYVEYFDGGVFEEDEVDMEVAVLEEGDNIEEGEGMEQSDGMEQETDGQVEEGDDGQEGDMEQETREEVENEDGDNRDEGPEQEDGENQEQRAECEGSEPEEGAVLEGEEMEEQGRGEQEAEMEEGQEEEELEEDLGAESQEGDVAADTADKEKEKDEGEKSDKEKSISKVEGSSKVKDSHSGKESAESSDSNRGLAIDNKNQRNSIDKEQLDDNTPIDTSDRTEESQSQTSVEVARKSKRHKRGLERELEQLDYWGRRQERDAKRRRRTLSSKLLGSIEEAEYLTWADLLRSFIPASLLNVGLGKKPIHESSSNNTLSSSQSTVQAAATTAKAVNDKLLPNDGKEMPAGSGPGKTNEELQSETHGDAEDKSEGNKETCEGKTVLVSTSQETKTPQESEENEKDADGLGETTTVSSVAPKDACEHPEEMDVDHVKGPKDLKAELTPLPEKKCQRQSGTLELRQNWEKTIYSESSPEEDQVEAFLLRYEENGGILDLLQQFLRVLLKKYGLMWPVSAARMFTDMYPRVRNHVLHRNALSLQEDRETLHLYSTLSLTNWELQVSLFQTCKQSTHTKDDCGFPNSCFEDPPHLEDDLLHLRLMLGRGDVWEEESPQFHTRLRWLQAQIKICRDLPEEAVSHLEMLQVDLDYLSDGEAEYIVDCARVENDTTVVSNSEVKRLLNLLQRSQMLEQVVDNYTDGRYRFVAELLTTIFHEPSPKPRPGVTLPTRQTQLAILIDSLYKLGDYKEVMTWGSQALSEAVKRYNRAEAEEEKNRWAKTLMKITETMNETITKDGDIVGEVDRKHLVEAVGTLTQMLVIQLEKSQSVQNLPFENLNSWILFHRLLSYEERLKERQQKVESVKTGGQEVEKGASVANESERKAVGKDEKAITATETNIEVRDPASDLKGITIESAVSLRQKRLQTETSVSGKEKARDEDDDCKPKGPVTPYPSTLFLLTAHDELGKHSWCCSDDGVFLLYCLDILILELARPLEDQHQQLLHQTLEQVSYCLYSHPSKKSKHKHLRDHGVTQIALWWERALQLYHYYLPATLPDFQSSQIPSITDDVSSLFKRIIALLPDEDKPEGQIDGVENYISGKDKCTYVPFKQPKDVKDIFYLLADYYFKSNEWVSAIKYYKFDVSIHIDRLDSWAPLALSMKAMLETQLNSCEVIQDEEAFFALAKSAVRCFIQALKLDEYHTNLWVEFGGLVYMVHSHASRLLKQDLNPDISLETFEMLEKIKSEMLTQSEKCFTRSLEIQNQGWDDESLPDERWLHCYMLGKISEKLGKPPQIILQLYVDAGKHLHDIRAKYPSVINYNSPQDYSVETLEMFFRAHAYILKYLQQREGKAVEEETIKVFNTYLDELSIGPFATYQEKKRKSERENLATTERNDSENAKEKDASEEKDPLEGKRPLENADDNTEEPPPKKRLQEDSEQENIVKDVVSNMIDDAVSESSNNKEKAAAPEKEAGEEGKTDPDIIEVKQKDPLALDDNDDEIQVVEEKVIEKHDHFAVIKRCLAAMKTCLSRFHEHYKAVYRLAHYYHNSKFHKDISRARNYMLGCEFWQRVGYMPINGLFNERKVWIQQPRNSNFFHGVWRIPNDEVDRPGSFAAHMYRCVSLTLDILPQMKDFFAILEIALALKNSPEKDKKYLRDNERELLSEHATQVGLQAMKDKFKLLYKSTTQAHGNRRLTFLLDVYRAYKQISKHLPGSEPHLAKMLTEAYASYKCIKMDNRSNVLREADSFCARNQHLLYRPPAHTVTNVHGSGPIVSRRGRPPGTGRGRGRGGVYSQPSPDVMAIQQAYKIYENLIQAQTLANNKDLDSATLFTYQKQINHYQAQLLKYLHIPSVSRYFEASLQGLGTTATKLPPPTHAGMCAAASNAPSTRSASNQPSVGSTSQVSSPLKAQSSQSNKPSQLQLSALAARSQSHGISITSVSSNKSAASAVTKPVKPNMSVTVSPAKSCPPALQGRGNISVSVSVSKSSPATTTSSTMPKVAQVTTTFTSTTAKLGTTKGVPPLTSNLKSKDSVPKLPAGTTLTRPGESPSSKASAPRPQLQAQVRSVKSADASPIEDSPRVMEAEILDSSGKPVPRPTTDITSTAKRTTISQIKKSLMTKDMSITPAPRIKTQTKVQTPPSKSTTTTASASSASSAFLRAYQASLGLTDNKASADKSSGSNASVGRLGTSSISLSTASSSGRSSGSTPASSGGRGAKSQAGNTGQVRQLSTSQLMQLAYGGSEKGARPGNYSDLFKQYSSAQRPTRGQGRGQSGVSHRPQVTGPRAQVPGTLRPQVPGAQRLQATGAQRFPAPGSQQPPVTGGSRLQASGHQLPAATTIQLSQQSPQRPQGSAAQQSSQRLQTSTTQQSPQRLQVSATQQSPQRSSAANQRSQVAVLQRTLASGSQKTPTGSPGQAQQKQTSGQSPRPPVNTPSQTPSDQNKSGEAQKSSDVITLD